MSIAVRHFMVFDPNDQQVGWIYPESTWYY